ncbi:calcium/sodium antiporter [soil metagenome]
MIVVLLLAGAVLLVAGAEVLVRSASRLATVVGVSPLVIGLTVVAFGTSAPELAVSIGATLEGRPDIAVGNVVGSNIFNVLFILGISALIMPLTVQAQLVRLDLPVMVAASVLLLALAWNGVIGRWEALMLLGGIVAYTGFLIRAGADRVETQAAHATTGTAPAARRSLSLAGTALGAVVGLVLLVIGSRWFVDGAASLAVRLGVSDALVGLTIIAAGTSLPEIATSVLASLRGERDIAIGNVVGSNIFNILGILGMCGLIAPFGVAVAPSILAFDLPIMIAVSLLALPIFISGMRIGRGEGLLFLGYYAAYTTFVVLSATQHDALSGFTSIMAFVVLPATAAGLLIGFRRAGIHLS